MWQEFRESIKEATEKVVGSTVVRKEESERHLAGGAIRRSKQ